MRKTVKFGLVFLVLAGLLLAAIFWALNQPAPALAGAVAITPCGYTNPPGNHLRFARLMISNQSSHTIRWRGNWMELEGETYHRGRTTNPNLPESTRRERNLKPGAAFTLACGEPYQVADGIRWRIGMTYSRLSWQERYVDFASNHRLPLGFGSFSFVNVQGYLNPTNQATATTPWLGQENPNARPPQ